jgi:hypothetical protein
MAFTQVHVLIGFAAAFAIVAVVILTAPSVDIGLKRLRRFARVSCKLVIIVGFATGVVTMAWGLLAHDAGMFYVSLAAFAVGILTSNFLSRSAF